MSVNCSEVVVDEKKKTRAKKISCCINELIFTSLLSLLLLPKKNIFQAIYNHG